MRILIAFILTALVSFNAFAGDCYCKDKTGSSKRACKNSPSECKSYCQEMNPANLPGWIVTISYSPGSCTSDPGMKYFRAHARPANYWNDTGIDIQAGETYLITVKGGYWKSNPYWEADLGNGNGHYNAGPSYLLPGKPQGSLIGRVGSGPVFYIGNSGKTPENSSGRLQVTVNDEPVGFGDNHGWLELEFNIQ